jgi:hypothetical protein
LKPESAPINPLVPSALSSTAPQSKVRDIKAEAEKCYSIPSQHLKQLADSIKRNAIAEAAAIKQEARNHMRQIWVETEKEKAKLEQLKREVETLKHEALRFRRESDPEEEQGRARSRRVQSKSPQSRPSSAAHTKSPRLRPSSAASKRPSSAKKGASLSPRGKVKTLQMGKPKEPKVRKQRKEAEVAQEAAQRESFPTAEVKEAPQTVPAVEKTATRSTADDTGPSSSTADDTAPSWNAAQWLTSVPQVLAILSDALLGASAVDESRSDVERIKGLTDANLDLALNTSSAQIKKVLRKALGELRNDWEAGSIFLGGSCNPTTWRADIAVPMLTAAEVPFFNPQVEDWTEDCVAIEAKEKEKSPMLLFVIDKETRALASIAEATEYIFRGRNIVLVIEDVPADMTYDGVATSQAELNDLNRSRTYLRDVCSRHAVVCLGDVEDAVNYVIRNYKSGEANEILKENLKAQRQGDARALHTKFSTSGDCMTFVFGGMEEYHNGLEGMIGNPDPRVHETVEWEHMQSDCSNKAFACWWLGKGRQSNKTTAREEYDYVAHQRAKEGHTQNGKRESGRNNWALQDFIRNNQEYVNKAGLKKVEVLVLRLYTGRMIAPPSLPPPAPAPSPSSPPLPPLPPLLPSSSVPPLLPLSVLVFPSLTTTTGATFCRPYVRMVQFVAPVPQDTLQFFKGAFRRLQARPRA